MRDPIFFLHARGKALAVDEEGLSSLIFNNFCIEYNPRSALLSTEIRPCGIARNHASVRGRRG